MAALKERYKIDFPQHMARCEANYWLLGKLMPGAAARDSWRFAVNGTGHGWRMHIAVTERMRYTTTVEIFREDAVDNRWLQLPRLTVRLYHDAQIAEVLAWEDHRRLAVRYDYPNRQMYQCDEKTQLNEFLGEWLNLSLAQGRSLLDVTLPINPAL